MFKKIQKKIIPTTLSQNTLVKSGIFVLGKILLFLAVYLGLNSYNSFKEAYKIKGRTLEELNASLGPPVNNVLEPTATKIETITKANIFSVKTAPKTKVIEKPKATELKFRLVGTLVTPGRDPIAIIEDTAQKKQDAFQITEKIFDKATLKEIYSDKVVVDNQGALETLELKEGLPGEPGESRIQSRDGSFTVPEEELSQALANLPVLLSQARAVPYFRNGESVGMRLYAIKSGSMYEKLGLKNSDIIKNINQSPVTDPAKALKLFEDLKSQRSIQVVVEREGIDVPLQYQIR